MKIEPEKIFNKIINIAFAVILAVLTLAIIISTFKLFLSIWKMLYTSGITGKHIGFIADVLTLFVLIELSRSLAEYFHVHRLRMTFIVDAAIVFFIREIMIMVFQHKTSDSFIFSMSALLLVLTILRVSSIFLFQREKRMVESSDKEKH